MTRAIHRICLHKSNHVFYNLVARRLVANFAKFMNLSNPSFKKGALILCSAILIIGLAYTYIAYAANTHSIDLESTSSQYLTAADSASLSVTGNLTLETWVKFESLPSSGSAMHFITKTTLTGDNRSWRFNLYNSSGTYQFKFEVASNPSTWAAATQNWTPSINTWYHVAVVYTASAGTADFYVDGVQQGTQQSGLPTSIYDGTSLVYLGSVNTDYDPSGGYLDGKMDDVRVWNVARTATQIADNRNIELAGNESGLKGYWKLNNDLNDSTSNGNTLTNNNSAVFSTDTPTFIGIFKIRKPVDESVASSTALQNDDDLKVTLAANKTYIVDGAIFISSASANPGFKMAFTVPTGATMDLGYSALSPGPGRLQAQGELLENSGTASQEIPMRANTPVVIHVSGTVKVGSTSGDVTLQWAQFTSDATAVKVMEGSYLRADQL